MIKHLCPIRKDLHIQNKKCYSEYYLILSTQISYTENSTTIYIKNQTLKIDIPSSKNSEFYELIIQGQEISILFIYGDNWDMINKEIQNIPRKINSLIKCESIRNYVKHFIYDNKKIYQINSKDYDNIIKKYFNIATKPTEIKQYDLIEKKRKANKSNEVMRYKKGDENENNIGKKKVINKSGESGIREEDTKKKEKKDEELELNLESIQVQKSGSIKQQEVKKEDTIIEKERNADKNNEEMKYKKGAENENNIGKKQVINKSGESEIREEDTKKVEEKDEEWKLNLESIRVQKSGSIMQQEVKKEDTIIEKERNADKNNEEMKYKKGAENENNIGKKQVINKSGESEIREEDTKKKEEKDKKLKLNLESIRVQKSSSIKQQEVKKEDAIIEKEKIDEGNSKQEVSKINKAEILMVEPEKAIMNIKYRDFVPNENEVTALDTEVENQNKRDIASNIKINDSIAYPLEITDNDDNLMLQNPNNLFKQRQNDISKKSIPGREAINHNFPKNLEEAIINLSKDNLIKVEKDQRNKVPYELIGNHFSNSFIYFGELENLVDKVDMILVIIGHESSGRTALIQTLLNYLEKKEINTLVTERYAQCYEDKNIFYNFGIDCQQTNELIITKTERFGRKVILIVEIPHFSVSFSPAFSEIKVIEQIQLLNIFKNIQKHLLVVKKSDESYMNLNMKSFLERNFTKFHTLNYIFTFYANCIIFEPVPKNIEKNILKINNNAYTRRNFKDINWRKLEKKMDKLFFNLFKNYACIEKSTHN
ncbi:hypothetical protein SteCoe_7403 [Stentor coeruleus]|uniref:Uncharacterized protein n=1 Tax=Stentor coeruleus TaxID=5963 RepID=A0A1R2CMQ1_9CILI|nr:hypothetical protein SteCoe_7403 [Stentor coeruleus]